MLINLKGMITIGSLVFIKGQIPELTPEQKARLAALEKIRDEDIDYSDIPPLRDDEHGKFKRLYKNGIVFKKLRAKLV